MERESFEDQEVADILNKNFISIKVDREERPDIDHMYMTYCQVFTGSGGWPLTVLMTPDKKPFFTGTYFPKHGSRGLPGVMDILGQISDLWKNERKRVLEAANELYKSVAEHYKSKEKLENQELKGEDFATGGLVNFWQAEGVNQIGDWGNKFISDAYEMLERSFDERYGGFGSAPKFPSSHNLGFMMRYYYKNPDSQALKIVDKTLASMADGGIYDHVGYGFARYSTDRYWLVPHFEKMLYDNATLAYTYLEAYQLTHKERFARVASRIFEYVLRDMTHSEGGFYSAEDADSEGIEGKFYLWTEDEIRVALYNGIDSILSGNKQSAVQVPFPDIVQKIKDKNQIFEIYSEAYGINEEGHYEGKNIPSLIFSDRKSILNRYNLKAEELDSLLEICNKILFEEREKRIHPAKDDKILASWNGIMIAAMAKGAQVLPSLKNISSQGFKTNDYLVQAEKAVRFIFNKMFNNQGRLLARYRDDAADYPAYLDDYAFLIYGLLELYTATGNPDYLEKALSLQNQQEQLFRDEEAGGYYFTGSDAEELLIRPKEVYDGAMPSGNSISSLNLIKLWKLTADNKWRELAEQQLTSFKNTIIRYPSGHTAFLQAIQYYLNEGEELVLSGLLQSTEISRMKEVFFKDFRPFSTVVYNEGTVQNIIPFLANYPIEEKAAAYLCKNYSCQAPVKTPQDLNEILQN